MLDGPRRQAQLARNTTGTAQWTGWPILPIVAPRPIRCGPKPGSVLMLASITDRTATRRPTRRARRRQHRPDARNRDYHELIKGRLEGPRWIVVAPHRRRGEGVRRHRPGMEKPLAEAAGIGWQGKHHWFPGEFGSWLLLGAIFTSADLPADAPTSKAADPAAASTSAPPTPSPRRSSSMRGVATIPY